MREGDRNTAILRTDDIEEAKKIMEIFANLSEENKTMAVVHASALRDKELMDTAKRQLVQQ